MKLSSYTRGIIFIDDKFEQVESLINYFKNQKINTLYMTPDDFDNTRLYFGYTLVFVDLAFDDGKPDIPRVVNIIRGISKNGEEHLLVVAWTQHEDDIGKLKEKLEEKMGKMMPLAILNAQKSNLLSTHTDEEFENLISNIFSDFIVSNHNLFVLLEWKENYLKSINEEFHNFVIQTYSDKINPILIDRRLGLYAAKTLVPNKVLSALEVLN